MSFTDGQMSVTNKNPQVGADCASSSQSLQQRLMWVRADAQSPAPGKAILGIPFRRRYPKILARSVSYGLSGVFGFGNMKGCKWVRWKLSHLCPAAASHLLPGKLIFKISSMLWIGAMAHLLPAPQLTSPEDSFGVTE